MNQILISILIILSVLLRLISGLLSIWPLLLLPVLFMLPVTPHIRWSYQYEDIYGRRIFSHCAYMGIHGLAHPPYISGKCPFIVLLATDQEEQP